ncbi:Tyrosine recombinase XerC [Polaribacter huanghezhanensis]|nr:Tyrosine recombinase XerC [Polaribacter huanghezhanensis]
MIGYREVLNNFLNLIPEVETPEDIKPFMVSEFFKRLGERAKGNGIELKVSTIRTYYNKLMVFFRWLEEHDYIEKYSLSKKIVKPPNPTYEDEKALNESEVSKIISAIALNNSEDEFMYKRDLVIVSILLYTGIRRGELLGLRTYDIDFEERTLFINGKTSKSRKSRFIPLHYSLLMNLKSYLKLCKKRRLKCEHLIVSSRQDRAFTDHGLKHWVDKYIRLSGVKFHIHRFRHTFACTLAKQNADIISIMNVLGHSSTLMTERYLRSIKSENSRLFIEKLSY